MTWGLESHLPHPYTHENIAQGNSAIMSGKTKKTVTQYFPFATKDVNENRASRDRPRSQSPGNENSETFETPKLIYLAKIDKYTFFLEVFHFNFQ